MEGAQQQPSTMEQRYAATRSITIAGAMVNVVLAMVKILFGFVGQSHALMADGVHSLSDLLSDGLVLFASKHASVEPDEDHPYGHKRFETVATVGLGLLLLLVAVGIAWDAGRRLLAPETLLQPGTSALAAAVASILAKEVLYQYTMTVARRLRSKLLKANAWHHRSDAVSSIVVVIGIGGAMAGMPYLDAVASIGVAIMIGKVGWDLGWQSIRELVDSALDRETVQCIRDCILEVDGVRDLHLLKTRRMGSDALVDVHILLNDPRLSVSEGHQISETVRGRLIGDIEDVADVMVHIDPEDDEQVAPNRNLPLRGELLKRLEELWQGVEGARAIERVNLHYLDGKVQVEVILPLSALPVDSDPKAQREAFVRAAGRDLMIGDVTLLYR